VSGLYFEEFEIGQVIRHSVTRTVTETDNLLFSLMTLNTQPLHLDAEFSKNTMWGQRLVNSLFTLGLILGMAVSDTTLGTTLGNLGLEEVRFPNPVFHGDTIHAQTEIIGKRESKSRPNAGIVFFKDQGFNQDDKLVCECRRAGLMIKRSPIAASGVAE
jgi:acyl dehydratase